MCSPVALGFLSFAVQGAQAIAGYQAQKQEYETNKENSRQAWKDQQEQLTLREMQEQDALRQKQQQQNIAEAQAVANTEVSASASGVAGISLDNLKRDVSRRAATNRQVEETNHDMIISQLKAERKGINSQAQSRINSVSKPSPLSLIAGIGSAGISGFNAYTKSKNMMMGDD